MWIGHSFGAFGIDIDQTHGCGTELGGELTITAVALISSEPFGLGTEIDVVIGFPHVRASASEAEGLKAHRF